MTEDGYEARNIFEAAYLYLQGCRLLDVTGTRPRAHFWFDNKGQMARRCAMDYSNDGSAPAKTLFMAFGRLKKEADAILGDKPWTG